MHPPALKDGAFVELPDVPAGVVPPLSRRSWARVLGARASAAGELGLPLRWWLLALVPFVALVLFPRLPGPGLGADDFGQYLMHAQALATGRHYGDINYIHSALNRWIGPENTLPGLPLLLAAVLRFGGVGLVPWVMLLVALCFPLLAGHYFARREPALLALGAALVCVLSPAIVFGSTQALTDIPFAAAVWALALVADREGDIGWRRVLALTVLGGAALLLRTAAVAIVPALLLTAFLRRRSGHGLKLALPVLAWALLGAVVAVLVGGQKLLLIHVHPGEWVRFALRGHYMKANALAYVQAMLDAQFEAPHNWLSLVLRALALGLTVVGLVEWMRRNSQAFLTVFTIVYGIMLLVLPFRDDRYLWPLLPLTTFGLLNAVRWIATVVGKPRVALRAAVGVALALALLRGTGTAEARRPISFGDQPEGRGLLDYLRPLAAREPVRLVFMKPRMLAWTLGVPVLGTFAAGPDASVRELCDRRITHVITSLVRTDRNGPLRTLAESRPDLFQLTYANPLYRVYHFSGQCTSAPVASSAGAGDR